MPTTFIDTSKRETIKYLSTEQLSKLLLCARKSSVRDYTILLTAYSHAMRISEVGRLQLQDYDTDTHRIKLRRVKGGHSPTYRTSEEVHKALTQWLKIRGPLSGPLFVSRRSKLGAMDIAKSFLGEIGSPSSYSGFRPMPQGITKRTLHKLFCRYSTEAGLPKDLRHFHVLRHSCAVHMVDRNIPLVQIQDWLGHKNIQSTMVYARVSDAKRDETARAFYAGGLDGQGQAGRKDGVQWSKDRKR